MLQGINEDPDCFCVDDYICSNCSIIMKKVEEKMQGLIICSVNGLAHEGTSRCENCTRQHPCWKARKNG